MDVSPYHISEYTPSPLNVKHPSDIASTIRIFGHPKRDILPSPPYLLFLVSLHILSALASPVGFTLRKCRQIK